MIAFFCGCGSATKATPDASGAAGASAGTNGGGGSGAGGASAGAGGASAGAGGASAGSGGAATVSAGAGGASAGGGGAAGVTDGGAADAPSEAGGGCSADAGASALVAGEAYGEYVLESVSLMGAPCGGYTFTVPDPKGDDVELRRVGSPTVIAHGSYDWRMTISATDSTMYATIHFAGYFDLVVGKAGSGTENLYDLMLAIFDGTKVLVVP
jgi:hypothetical protein